jgi:hypothetical protein
MRKFSAIRHVAILVLVMALGGLAASAATGDLPGSKDYPGIGRFAGSIITRYDAKDFDAVRLQAAPFAEGKPTDARKVEGRAIRIAYPTTRALTTTTWICPGNEPPRWPPRSPNPTASRRDA